MSKSGAVRLWVETHSNLTSCLIGITLYFAERIHPRQAGGLAFVVDRAVGETPCGLICVPVYWIVNLVDRRLEVYSEPDSGGYRARQVLTAGQHVSVVIAGTEIGRIAVADLLP